MKYNEFIHVEESFRPVFDLENEVDQYWALFIPNDKFKEVLGKVMDSLNYSLHKNPVWLQGTYGTGKSHATSVIKHLLCDDKIPDTFDLEDHQLTGKLNNFRSNNKIFPVVLKGTSNIGTSQRLTFTLQTAVKKALKNSNMQVSIPSDFENLASLCEDGILDIPTDDISGTDLEIFGKDDIVRRLRNEETEVLVQLEEILNNRRIGTITQDNIVNWLISVRDELKEKYDIDYLMIFWDEFTGVLRQLNVEEILLDIQSIAEANEKGVSLFLVSHISPTSKININQAIIDKISDRFETIHYYMESVTTYQLMEKSIRKDKDWEKVRNRFVDKVNPLIERITENEASVVKGTLRDLYPIHPYTAYLSTFISDLVGSSERTIFEFLHNDVEYGFKHFIDTYEINERYFLTAEYLWDFFYNIFDKSTDDIISSSVKRYKLKFNTLKKEGNKYLVIFKVILLLNVLFKKANVEKDDLAVPSRENIKNVFIGSFYENDVDSVLTYIDNNDIINESHDNLFELTTNALPAEEVNQEIKKLEQNLYLKDLIDENRTKEIKDFISKKTHRKIEIAINSGDIKENKFINDLENGVFNKKGYLHMFLFLCKTPEEFSSINKIREDVLEKGFLKGEVFVVSEAILEKHNLDNYLKSKASAIVADKHNHAGDVDLYNKRAKECIDDWVEDIKRKTVSWYLNEDSGRLELNAFINKLNSDLSKSIFYCGLENIQKVQSYKNIWPDTVAKAQAEKYITSKNFNQLYDSLRGLDKKTLGMLYDNNSNLIIEETTLKLKDNAPEKHPLNLIQLKVDELLSNVNKKRKFNLGTVLMPLLDAPYGLYPSKCNVAALSFCLRKYVNQLYDNKGYSLDETRMKNMIVTLFDFWQKGRKQHELKVRFGSEEENELTNLLIELFNLDIDSEIQSIKNVKWGIRDWIKSKKAPLWLFKYAENYNTNLNGIFNSLALFLKPNDLDEDASDDQLIKKCYAELKSNKIDFKLTLKNDSSVLFGRFVKNLNCDINKIKLETLLNYLIETMPEEIDYWDENKIGLEITKWVTQKEKEEVKCKAAEAEEAQCKIEADQKKKRRTKTKVESSKNSEKIVNILKEIEPKEFKNRIIEALKDNPQLQLAIVDLFKEN